MSFCDNNNSTFSALPLYAAKNKAVQFKSWSLNSINNSKFKYYRKS